jgi:hypothetical protein
VRARAKASGELVCRAAEWSTHAEPTSPRSDGSIDADELEQVFKQLGHKCKRVRRSADCRVLPVA